MKVTYKGEQTLSVDGELIGKGEHEVSPAVAQKLKKMSEGEAYKDQFEFDGEVPAAPAQGVGGTQQVIVQGQVVQPAGGVGAQAKLSPEATDSFGSSGEIRSETEAQGLAGDTDIAGDSEQKMVGGSEDTAAQDAAELKTQEAAEQGRVQRSSKGKLHK